jgi:hypothetical protein
MSFSYRNDPILSPALAYWVDKCGTHTMPLKRDIDPTEISPKLLPHLQIMDVLDGGTRFRYRLVGTALVQTYGKDYTGAFADELVSGDRLRFIHDVYQSVCKTKKPIFSHNRYQTVRDTDLVANRIYMPLADNNATEVRYILGALNFTFGDAVQVGVWGLARLEPTEQYIEPIDISATAGRCAAVGNLFK